MVGVCWRSNRRNSLFELRPPKENWKQFEELNTRCVSMDQPQMPRSGRTGISWLPLGIRYGFWDGLTQVAERLRDHAVPRKILEVPFRSSFSLPCPEDPAISLLVGDKLGLDEALDVATVGVAETRDRSGVFSIARADVVRSLVALLIGTIVAGTDATAVEPLEMRLVT